MSVNYSILCPTSVLPLPLEGFLWWYPWRSCRRIPLSQSQLPSSFCCILWHICGSQRPKRWWQCLPSKLTRMPRQVGDQCWGGHLRLLTLCWKTDANTVGIFLFFKKLIRIIYLCACIYGYMCVPWPVCGSQKTTYRINTGLDLWTSQRSIPDHQAQQWVTLLTEPSCPPRSRYIPNPSPTGVKVPTRHPVTLWASISTRMWGKGQLSLRIGIFWNSGQWALGRGSWKM